MASNAVVTGAVPANAQAVPTPAPAVAPPGESGAAALLSIDDEGLRIVDPTSGATRPVAFGTPRSAVLEVLAGRGAPEIGRNEECGYGPVDFAEFSGGLMVLFQEDRFVGWSLGREATEVTTMAGVGPGSTRAQLAEAYDISVEETSIGTEFTVGETGGLLDGTGRDARITAMWAGANCIAR